MNDLSLQYYLFIACCFYLITPLIGIWDLATHNCPNRTTCSLAVATPLIVWAIALLAITVVTGTDDLVPLSVTVLYRFMPYLILATMLIAVYLDYTPFTDCVFSASNVLFTLATATVVTLLYLSLTLVK